jgi:uncharacterized protein
VFKDYNELLLGKRKATLPTGACVPFGKKMFVTVTGKILPCERIGQQFLLGRVTESGVELDLEAIAAKCNFYYSKVDRQCKKCCNATACIQCVFNLHDLENSPVCYGFMNRQRFEAYKASQMDFLRKYPEDYYRIMEEVVIE